MADNLTDIKNSVQNIQTNIDTIKQSVANLDDIENKLKEVSKNTKPTGGIREDTKKIKEGVFEVVSKLDALKAIESWTKNQNGSTGSTGNGVVGTIDSKIDSLVNYQKGIHGFTNEISTHTKKISQQTELASEYLKALKEHIVDGGASPQGTVTGNATDKTSKEADAKGIASIDSNVKKIVSIMETMKATALADQDEELKSLLIENEKGKAKDEAEQRKYNEIAKKDKKDRTKDEKKFLEDYRKAQQNKKKEDEKLNGKGGSVSAAAAKGFTTAASLISEKQTVGKLADKGISAVSQMGPYGAVIGGIMQLIKAGISLGSERDRATSTYSRTIGGGVSGKLNIGETVSGFISSPENKADIGATFAEAMSAMTEYAEAIGRSTERIAHADVASAISLKRFGISADAIGNFDSFGKSLQQTDEFFSRLYTNVSKKGLSFKNVSKAVNDNLKMAQSHTFANGLRGLERMAEKSTQLKYNMQQVFQFADKVSEIEGAISTAANLSVLGGEFAQFSNPMQLLYEGLNDTEALNDRIIKMFGNKAYFNNETGQMDMNAYERERLKQAAKGAGLDPGEMLNLAFNQGKMKRISSQIAPGVDKDTAEYIKNLGELDKNGQAYVSINGEKKFLNRNYAKKNGEQAMTAEDYKELQKETEKREEENSATLGRVWRNTNGIFEKLDNMLAYLQERLGAWVFKIFQKIVGGEEAKRETVREWAANNNKDRDDALNYYDKNKNNRWGQNAFSLWWNTSILRLFKKREYSSDWYAKNMDNFADQIKDADDVQGNSPNGLPIVSNIPGRSGFANGPSHWDGGVKAKYRGQPWEIEGTEFLLNKLSSLKYRDILPQLQNGTFNPYSYSNGLIKNDMEKYYRYQPVSPYSRNSLAQKNVQSTPNQVSGTIKVDIPQTITINIAGGGTIGNYDISEIISKYVDQFMKEMMMRKDFSGFNKEEFHNKSSVI